MLREIVRVPTEPRVLRWARESAGLTIDEVARRFRKAPEAVRLWETKSSLLSLTVLRGMATLYKRPLPTFLLEEPIPNPPMPVDFRFVPAGARLRKLSPATRLALRRAQHAQAIAAELEVDRGDLWEGLVGTRRVRDDIETVARAERRRLGVGDEEQLRWRSPHEAYRAWRSALEDLGILVFQFSLPLDETKGFSLAEVRPPAVVVNSADHIHSRIFTVFHEYVHILLGTGGICVPETTQHAFSPADSPERFCNRVAGALLVPDRVLKSHPDIGPLGELDEPPPDRLLAPLVENFKVSRYVIWYRLRSARIISAEVYRAKWAQWAPSLRSRRPPKKRTGPRLKSHQRSYLQHGHRYSSLVVEAEGRGMITTSDALELLGLRRVGDLESLSSLVREG